MREDIKSMTLPELQGPWCPWVSRLPGRTDLYLAAPGGEVLPEMTNLSKDLRRQLEERYEITVPQVVRKQESRKDGTVKYLWRLSDGNCVETVLMRYHYGNSARISSEVAAPWAAPFAPPPWGLVPPAALGDAGSGALPSWTPDCPFPILCSWASGSR